MLDLFPISTKAIRQVSSRIASKEQAVQLAIFAAKRSLEQGTDSIAQEALDSAEEWIANPSEEVEQRARAAAQAYVPSGWTATVAGARSKQMAAHYAASAAAARNLQDAAGSAVDACVAAFRYNPDLSNTINAYIKENI